MLEFGFWEYTAPGGGSVDTYTNENWDILLDDMAAGGMNSLVLCVKWLTTGYRSKYDWLDQDAVSTAISTDNSVIYYALREARKRGMKIWLLVVGTQYNAAKFGIQPANPDAYWGECGMYDPDQPGIAERIELLYAEIIELFGEMADGLIAELEFCDRDSLHRVPIYNEWARQENRPDYDSIKRIALEPRGYPFIDWRDFSTDRRSVILKRIESVVHDKGFTGQLTTIIEVGSCDGVMVRNVNLPRLRNKLPTWGIVTYDSIYDRRINRLSSMDFCIVQPRELGYEVNYLTRGVMTFGANWDDITDSLNEQWQMVYEDAINFKPDRFWFMGADATNPHGMVCNPIKLPQWGYPDGRTARMAMLEMAKKMGVKITK